MSEHLTKTQIEDYGRQTVSAAEFLSASRHLRDCEACRLKVERVLGDDGVFYALKSEVFSASAETVSSSSEHVHLTFELTAAYVDEALSGEELQLVKDHLTGCEQCAMAVDDLRAFRNRVMPGLDREYHPPHEKEPPLRRSVAAAQSPIPRSPAPVESSLAGPQFILSRSPALVAGSALAALLMIAVGLMIWDTTLHFGKDPKIGQTTPSPTTPVVSPNPTQGGSAVIAQLNDGAGQMALDGNGKLSGVDHLPPAYQQMIRNALSSQLLEKPQLLAGLVRPDDLLMRGGDNQGNKFSVINPIGIVIFSDRPTFRWSPLDGATGYVVEVYDDKLSQVTTSSQLKDTSWTTPQSLKRGAIYSWQVTAIRGGEEFSSPRPPAPLAKFRILDETLANEVVQARRDHAASHLTMALIYTKSGLLDDAEREFRMLYELNPNSRISRRLLESLSAMRR